jgi:NAD(P)-dependent dehydrogenase (short-subunit alcohol dehydrogenase family)
MSEAPRYLGKVALITGAGGGIGRATAERLAGEGAALLLADVAEPALAESADAARKAGARVVADGVRVVAVAADVARLEDFEALVARAERELGGLDLLVNNAGIEGVVAPIESYPLDVFDRVLAVNVRGVFLGMRAAAPALRRRGGGAIVNLASVAGVTGDPNLSAYIASKHAVIGLTRSGALAFGKDGVRVNAVAPSPVETRMMRSLEAGMGGPQGAEAVKKLVAERIPLGRYAEPAEVAALIAFLGSDEARFITGSIYTIDGGMTPI